MKVKPSELSNIIEEQIEKYGEKPASNEIGRIVKVGDGIALVYGLQEVMLGELIDMGSDISGMVLSLEEDLVGIAVLGEDETLVEGSEVKRTGKVVEVPVGEHALGRVINPLGLPIDGLGTIESSERCPVDAKAPGIVDRQPVSEPMMTGIKMVDALTPIGRGQRQLIIGDRQTGKTAIAVDAIINQKDSDIYPVYVAIGQKSSTVARVVDRLKYFGVMDKTVAISASASDPAPLQYLAPYAGATIAEYFMRRGKHALVIYDDLSKHAIAYRQLSLLLRRPPGREAYPGDIFYIHSRLLERSAKLSGEKGAGSFTALPIIETQAGDLSAYIPTNLVSITDGQIYLESDIFNAGIRPAVNVGLSVSRVGSSAQKKAMKNLVGTLRIELAQYREVAAFAQFGAELDSSTKKQIRRGKRLVEMLKQPQYSPLSLGQQVVEIYVGMSGRLDKYPAEKVREYLDGLNHFIQGRAGELIDQITAEGEFSDEIKVRLDEIIADYDKIQV